MSWFEDLFGGSSGGSSLMDVAKGAQGKMSFLQAIGLSPDNVYDSPIGPQAGTGNPMQAGVIDPATRAQQRQSLLANLGGNLSRFGAGMSAASGPSRMPVDFGQAIAGGTQALEAGQDRDLTRRKTEAEINALGAKSSDIEQQAQQVMMKQQMGVPLTPAEQAIANTYDAFQNKMQTVTMPDGTVRQVPAQRPVFGQIAGGRATPQGGGQAPRPPLNSFMR